MSWRYDGDVVQCAVDEVGPKANGLELRAIMGF